MLAALTGIRWVLVACALVSAVSTSLFCVAPADVPARAAPAPPPGADGRAPDTVLLVADVWPPFNDTPGAAPEGYVVDLAREVFRARGLRVDYRREPWPRAKAAVREGTADGVIGASRTECPELTYPTQEVDRNVPRFAVLRGSAFRYEGPPSLAAVRLGAVLGYDYGAAVNAWIAAQPPGAVELRSGDTAAEQNLRMLLAGRVDVVVDSEVSLLWQARRLGAADRVVLASGTAGPADPDYVVFTADARGRALAGMWDEGLAVLRASGALASTLGRYGLADWRAGGPHDG
jgi:polar amino acid transport system substrate-binding protein